MRVIIPQIAWHARDPVLTLDFDPRGKTEEGYYRLASGGADRLLLIWRLSNPSNIKPDIICVSELTRHQKGINVVRFSPCGNYIASGDDDSYVFIWKCESVAEKEEVWNVEKIFRRHVEDVTDLCWSPDSNFIVSGSVDNTAVLWDVKKGTPIHFWSEREHTGFVQGVAYDPLGEFSVTMCIDRNLRFFNNKNGKVISKTLKYPSAWLGYNEEDEAKENAPLVESATSSQVDSVHEGQKQGQEVADGKQSIPIEEANNNDENESACKTVTGLTTSPVVALVEAVKDNAPIELAEECRDKPLSEINTEDDPVVPFKLPPKRPVTTLNRLFHDDSLKTFCRRISCSPRGELMIVPGGLVPPIEKGNEEKAGEEALPSRQSTPVEGEEEEIKDGELKEKEKIAKKYDPEQQNAAIIFCRNSWSNPCAVIPTGLSYSIAAKFNPVYFQRERQSYDYDSEFVNSSKKNERIISCVGKLRPQRPEEGILLNMPYRLVYAVATNDCLLIGDTASIEPLACIRNIHCTRMTDISWSPDGLILIASSTDGFCSILTFEEGELGNHFKVGEGEEFPALTPTCFPIAPPEPKPVKKKEPKEPKEPKDPNELKELKEKKEKERKEKKEKEKKEKKEKEKKEKKDPATPSESKEEKKKKMITIDKMFKNSPVASSPSTPPVIQKLKVEEIDLPSPSESSPVVSSATPNTPKPTLMDSWIKKTPKSAISEVKVPRRIQLTAVPKSTAENDKTSLSCKTSENKAPRRIQLTTITKPGMPKTSNTPTNCSNKSDTDSIQSSSKQAPVKQPRRIELINLDDEEPQAKRRATEDTVVNKPMASCATAKASIAVEKSSEKFSTTSEPQGTLAVAIETTGNESSKAETSGQPSAVDVTINGSNSTPGASNPVSKVSVSSSIIGAKAPRRITPVMLSTNNRAENKGSDCSSHKVNSNPVEKVIAKLSTQACKDEAMRADDDIEMSGSQSSTTSIEELPIPTVNEINEKQPVVLPNGSHEKRTAISSKSPAIVSARIYSNLYSGIKNIFHE